MRCTYVNDTLKYATVLHLHYIKISPFLASAVILCIHCPLGSDLTRSRKYDNTSLPCCYSVYTVHTWISGYTLLYVHTFSWDLTANRPRATTPDKLSSLNTTVLLFFKSGQKFNSHWTWYKQIAAQHIYTHFHIQFHIHTININCTTCKRIRHLANQTLCIHVHYTHVHM